MNEFVSRSMVAIWCAAGAFAFVAMSPPAPFAQDEGGHRASASGGTFHLWWNSENYIVAAQLGAELPLQFLCEARIRFVLALHFHFLVWAHR